MRRRRPSFTSLGDLDGDGLGDLAVGASGDGDGGPGRGAVWVLFLDGVQPPGDMNCDGRLDGADIDPFFSCLGGVSCPGIAISQQPQSHDLCLANVLNLTVDATGLALGYQWRHDGTAIAGATQSTYTVNAVTLADAGAYDVQITNSCGAAVSDVATITVADLIFMHPVSQTVCENDPVLFSVTAIGQALTYQWRKDGVEIPDATSSLFIIPAAQMSDAGVYEVVVTSPQCAQISEPATLTVRQCP